MKSRTYLVIKVILRYLTIGRVFDIIFVKSHIAVYIPVVAINRITAHHRGLEAGMVLLYRINLSVKIFKMLDDFGGFHHVLFPDLMQRNDFRTTIKRWLSPNWSHISRGSAFRSGAHMVRKMRLLQINRL